MASKRKTAAPVVERGIFTDELPPANVATVQAEEDFFANAAKGLKDFRTGRRMTPVATVSFASVPALLEVLTPKRYALIEAVKSHGRFDSIEALASALQRDRGAVSRDLKALAEAGLLRVQEVVHPGHGRRSAISPVAQKISVELTI